MNFRHIGPVCIIDMPQIDIDGTVAIDHLLGEGRDDLRQLAPFQAHRVDRFHEALAARIDQPRAVGDRHVIARKVIALHQHVERAAECELHVDEARPGSKGHGHPIARVVVNAMGALHGDHACRDDRAFGPHDDELAVMNVETDGARH